MGTCGYLSTEIHEILHIMGYDHSGDSKSIMYSEEFGAGHTTYKEGDCVGSDRKIDEEIVADLMKTYKK